MNDAILQISNLNVTADGHKIINGLNLVINPGEIHAIMGPNGAGKSTLANVLARHPDYLITEGTIKYQQQDIKNLSPEACAQAGIFLGFQYPVAIPGVTNIQFLKTAVNAIRKARGNSPLDAADFLSIAKTKLRELEMSEELLKRSINDGFSGGEKKRNEILQLLLLEPTLAILDETDSGLDIDALKVISHGINSQRNSNRATLLITHYQRLLDYVEPDFVHVMIDGKIIHSGDKSLALTLEEKGYGWLKTC